MWWLQRVTGAGLVSMSTPLIWLECVALCYKILFVNLTKDDVVQWLLKVIGSVCSYFSAFKAKSQLNSYSLSIRQLMSFCLNQKKNELRPLHTSCVNLGFTYSYVQFSNNETHPFHIPSSQDCWDKLGSLSILKFKNSTSTFKVLLSCELFYALMDWPMFQQSKLIMRCSRIVQTWSPGNRSEEMLSPAETI